MSRFSSHPFKVYGQTLPGLIKIPQPDTTMTFDEITLQVYDSIESKYSRTINWSSLNQRYNYPLYRFNNLTDSLPDNKVDYVVVSFRWNGQTDPWNNQTNTLSIIRENDTGGWPNGYARISRDYINTGKDSVHMFHGFTTLTGLMGSQGFKEFFFHEFAHNLYSAPHYNGANSVTGNHFYTNSGWGMMGSGARHKSCALGWEQWWLGWNSIEHDYSSIADNGTYTLTDFITTGSMMRLKIPNTGQYLWLEYHNGQSVFEDRSSLIDNYLDEHFPETADGVLAYTECISPGKNEPFISRTGMGGIMYLHGLGSFDYTHSATKAFAPEWGRELYDFYPDVTNPFSWQNGVTAIRSDYSDFSDNEIPDNWIRHSNNYNSPKSYDGDGNEMVPVWKTNGTVTYDEFGRDMNLKVNNSYSISSNPAIIEHQFYYSSDDYWDIPDPNPDTVFDSYYNKTDSLTPIRLHGLRIKIVSQTETEAQIQVEYGYNKVDQNTRWTGNIELPENQQITIDGVTVTMDRTGTPSREYPDPESGFYPYTNFELENGSELVLDNNAILDVSENTTITMHSGSQLTIKNGSELILDNSTLIIESGATLSLASDDIVIRNEGELIIESGATLALNTNNDIDLLNYGVLTINGTLVFNGGTLSSSDLSEININGNLHVNTNKSATINSNINLNGNITGDSGSVLNMFTDGRYTINIGGYRKIDNFASINFKNANINNTSTSSRLQFSNCPDLNITDIDIYGVGNHGGLRIYNCNDAYFASSTIANAHMGFQLINSDRLSSYALTITDNNIGIWAYNSSFTNYYSTISNNKNVGVWYEDLTGDTELIECYMYNNGYNGAYEITPYGGDAVEYQGGIVNDGYGLGNLYVDNCLIENNIPSAIDVRENASYLSCSKIVSIDAPDQYGIVLKSGALGMTQTQIQQSQFAIYGVASSPGVTYNNQLDVWNYNNDLGSSSVGIYGEFSFIGSFNGYSNPNEFDATGNLWQNPGYPPQSGLDYIGPQYIYDYAPLNQFIRNGMVCPGALPGLKGANISSANNYKHKPLKTQLKHYTKLHNHLLLQNELMVKDSAYFKMKELLSAINYEIHDNDSSKAFAKMLLQVQLKQFNFIDNEVEEFVSLCIDASKTLNFLENYKQAIVMLDSALALAPANEHYRLNRAKCKINAKMQYENSNGELDILELLAACSGATVQKSGDYLNAEGSKTIINDEIELLVSPNPVSGISNINLCISDKYLGSELKIIDSSGKIVISQWVSENPTNLEISNSELNEGIYLVGVYSNGKVIASQKIVVVK